MFELVTLANTYADNKTVKVETVQYLLDTILLLLGVFGITELNDKPQITDAQKQLLAARVSARAAHDFELSDQIRQQLSEGGVIVEDTAQGQRWHQA